MEGAPVKTAMFTIAILLSSCSFMVQTTEPQGRSINASVSWFSKNAVTGMSGPAGNVEGIVSDSEAAATALATYGLGKVTVESATKAEIAKSSHAMKTSISNNKTSAAIKKIEVGGEVKKQALQIEP